MKKLFITVWYLVAVSFCVYSQDITHNVTRTNETIFKKVLNEQFSSLVTGQSQTSVGNFASIDLKETEVAFAGNSITKNGQVFGLTATGGVSDGLFSVFKNSKFNTKIALEGQFNFMYQKNKEITYYNASYRKYQADSNEIEQKYASKRVEAQLATELLNYRLKARKIQTQINLINVRLRIENSVPEITRNQLTIDSLNSVLATSNSELTITNTAIQNYPRNPTSRMEDVDFQRSLEIKKLNLDIALYALKFGWISIYYKASNNSFKLLNPSMPYNNQITSSSYIGHEFRIRYNKYNWTKEPFKTYFYCFGVSFSETNNLSELNTREITEVQNYGPNPNDRSSTKKYNVFLGEYEKNLNQVSLFGDYYRFLFANNIAAFHVYPEFKYRDNSKPKYNLGLGILYAFKSTKKDDKSLVNAEVFYEFIDLSKTSESNLRLFERNDIGIRFSFPINFINK